MQKKTGKFHFAGQMVNRETGKTTIRAEAVHNPNEPGHSLSIP